MTDAPNDRRGDWRMCDTGYRKQPHYRYFRTDESARVTADHELRSRDDGMLKDLTYIGPEVFPECGFPDVCDCASEDYCKRRRAISEAADRFDAQRAATPRASHQGEDHGTR